MAGIGSNHSRFNISAEVSTVLPQYIKSNAPDLEVFLKKYLEFLELENESTYYINNILNNRDLDHLDDHFLGNIQNEIGQSIPKEFATDSRLLYKHLTELYKSRGTIDSITAFFNVLYNDSAQIYFPKDDMLKPSDGKFIKNNLDIDNLENKTPSYIGIAANGYKSTYDNSMSGDSVNFVRIPEIKNIEVTKLFVFAMETNSGPANTYKPELQPTISLHEVKSSFREITWEDMEALGEINWGLLPFDPNLGYFKVPSYNEWHFKFDEYIWANSELRFYPRGYSVTNDGFISDTAKKIQDSYYYQQFSYEIQTGVDPKLWHNAFNRLIHTAGFIFFNKISIHKSADSPFPMLQFSLDRGEPVIYFWLPVVDAKLKFHDIYNGIHGFMSIEDRKLRFDNPGWHNDWSLQGYKDIFYLGISVDLEINDDKHIATMGPAGYFDKMKFKLTGGVKAWDSVTFIDVLDTYQTYRLYDDETLTSYKDIKYTKGVANSNMNSIIWPDETLPLAWNADGPRSKANPIPLVPGESGYGSTTETSWN